jgi:hypothetical protein
MQPSKVDGSDYRPGGRRRSWTVSVIGPVAGVCCGADCAGSERKKGFERCERGGDLRISGDGGRLGGVHLVQLGCVVGLEFARAVQVAAEVMQPRQIAS